MLHLPFHLSQTEAFRRLKKTLNSERNAFYVIHVLFIELGLQSEEHGKPGLFRSGSIPAFVEMFNEYEDLKTTTIPEYLVRTGWLVAQDQDYYCPIFARHNPHLSEIHVNNERAEKASRSYAYYSRRSKNESQEDYDLVCQLTDIWLKPDNTRMTPAEMNQALTLIRIIDLAMGRKARRSEDDFKSGVVLSAHSVTASFAEERLEAIIKRIIYLRDTGEIPRRTEAILKDFDAIYYRLLPVNGWLDWQNTTK